MGYKAKKINNVFLKYFVLENDVGWASYLFFFSKML